MKASDLPRFIEDRSFSILDTSKSESEHLYGMLNNVKRIHELTVQPWEDHQALISALLKAGCEIFGLETGIVSHIEEEAYTVIGLHTHLEGLEEGAVFDLKGTYCYDVFRFQRILGYPKVGDIQHLKTHPVYLAMKLEAYLSAPIYVGGKLYGTINFTSQTPREHGFSENERNLIMLLAGSIANQIHLDHEKRMLEITNERLKSLVGYVAHDIRNHLSGLDSLTSMLKEGKPEELEWDSILTIYDTVTQDGLELVREILDMSALGNGKIDLHLHTHSLRSLIHDFILPYQSLFAKRNLEIKFEANGEGLSKLDPQRLNQVFLNLFHNAYKFAAEGSIILLTLKEEQGRAHVEVMNQLSSEKPMNRSDLPSTRYGMEIVGEILRLHQSELDVVENEEQYVARFSLPLDF